MKIQQIMKAMFAAGAVMLGIGYANMHMNHQIVYGAEFAEQIEVTVKASNGDGTSKLRDGSYSSSTAFTKTNPLTIASSNGTDQLYGVYVIWAKVPDSWTLSYDGKTVECGTDGFLHEYVAIPEGTGSVTMTFTGTESICDIYAYSDGTLPAEVQTWKPVCERADMLFLSSHADDEILFLGGALAEYAGEEQLAVQVVYFSNYFGGTVIREHEKLDGLWAMGVRNYPVNGDFPDLYADNLASAEKQFGYDKTLEWTVEQIRRFQPLVCVAQDTNGEYGHGTHQLTSKAMQEAVTVSMKAEVCPESAARYGTFDVPKTYIHLYGENQMKLDCRKPLNAFDGQTALEVASAAYKKHVSQQWCWFYVSDEYEYSCAEFGLYRTTVGMDTQNDMMEHVTSYEEQARLAAEQLAAENASKQAEEAAILDASLAAQQQEIIREQKADQLKDTVRTAAVVIAIMALAVIVLVPVVVVLAAANKKRKRRRKKGGRSIR